jgi:hypothetical protein
MAASDRFTLGVLSFLSLGTFAAIFGATQERKVERYRRQGAETTAGVRLVTSAGAIRLCGSIDGHHETR